jgi:hypothetical protein
MMKGWNRAAGALVLFVAAVLAATGRSTAEQPANSRRGDLPLVRPGVELAQSGKKKGKSKTPAAPPVMPLPAGVKPSLVIGVRSVDELFNDLKFLLVDLAGDPKSFETVESGLISGLAVGVERTRPLGVRGYVAKDGLRTIFSLPVATAADLKQLLRNIKNLSVLNTPVEGKNNLYQLADLVDGFLRYEPTAKEVLFGISAADVQALQPGEAELKAGLGEYDLALFVNNANNPVVERKAAFDKIRSETMASIRKLEKEDAADFEIRKLATEQQWAELERFIVESTEIRMGWKTDAVSRKGSGSIRLKPAPDTSLARSLAQFGEKPSAFGAVPAPEKTVGYIVSNFPLDSMRKEHLTAALKLWRPRVSQVLTGAIAGSDSEKQLALDLADVVFQVLEGIAATEVIDSSIRTFETDAGSYTTVGALGVQDGAVIAAALKRVQERYPNIVKLDTAVVGDTSLHTITLTDRAKQYPEILGAEGVIYIGTSKSAVWFAAGDAAQESLTAAITAASAGPKPVPALEIKAQVAMYARILDRRLGEVKGLTANKRKRLFDALTSGAGEYYFKIDRNGDEAVLESHLEEALLKAVSIEAANQIRDKIGG